LAVIYGILTIESPKWRGMNITPEEVKEMEIASKELRENPIQLDFTQEVA